RLPPSPQDGPPVGTRRLRQFLFLGEARAHRAAPFRARGRRTPEFSRRGNPPAGRGERSNCSPCPICTRRSSRPAGWATASISCFCWSSASSSTGRGSDGSMADKSLTRKTARELAAMIKSRAASPVEVLDAHLAVIARVNPKLNAIGTLAAEQAREHARAVEAAVMRGERLGTLAGGPVAIKDVTPTAGIRTTFGSPLYKDHVPEEDAEAVRRLKAAGAI